MRTDAAKNRDRIIDAYIELASPHRAYPTPTDVADAAGVSRVTLYRHFSDGEALRRAASIRLLDDVTDFLEEAIGGDGTIEEKLTAITDGMFVRVGKMQLLFSGQDWYDRKSMSHWTAWIRPLVNLIRSGQESGELRVDLPADWMADALLWLLYGATIIPAGFDRYNVARRVVSTFLDGTRGSQND
jgi:TetR/AcrR family transcriptional regulator, mexCD-oprJ operon repressor